MSASKEQFADHPPSRQEEIPSTNHDRDQESELASIDLYSYMTHEYKRDGDIDVSSVAFSPDGRHIAVGGIEKKIIILDASTFDVLHECDAGQILWTVAYSPDGQFIAVGGFDKTVSILDSSTLDVVMEREVDDWIRALAYSADGENIAVAGWSKKAVFLESTKLEVVREHMFKRVLSAVAYSPNGEHIAIGGFDGTVVTLDTKTLEVVAEYNNVESVLVLAYTPDGKYLALAGKNKKLVFLSEHNLSLQSLPITSENTVNWISFRKEISESTPNDLYPAAIATGKTCLCVNLHRNPGSELEPVLCTSSGIDEQNKSPKNKTVIAST